MRSIAQRRPRRRWRTVSARTSSRRRGRSWTAQGPDRYVGMIRSPEPETRATISEPSPADAIPIHEKRDYGPSVPILSAPRERILARLESAFAPERRGQLGDDFPTEHALRAVRRLLGEAAGISRINVLPSSIECFEGDVLMHWRFGGRGVSLIGPADAGKKPKLYRETVKGDLAATTSLKDAAAASDLVEWLQWAIAG